MSVQFTFDLDRTVAAIAYLASKNLPGLTKYKLCKLLFIADKYHLVRYGRPITGDRYTALQYGPVPSKTLNLLNTLETGRAAPLAPLVELDYTYKYPHLRAKTTVDESLSISDKEALDHTVEHFGSKTFEELKAITHEMPAYRKAWDEKPQHRHAEPMKFEDFFEEDGDAIGGAYEEMIENDALRRAFAAH